MAAVGAQAPVWEALTTPLMVGLAKFISQSSTGEEAEDLPDPAEPDPALADRAAVEALLFDAFDPRRLPPSRRWPLGGAASQNMAGVPRSLPRICGRQR